MLAFLLESQSISANIKSREIKSVSLGIKRKDAQDRAVKFMLLLLSILSTPHADRRLLCVP